MIKKVTSILLIFVTVAALVHSTFPFVWYAVNYTYIVTELCVNRDNPEMDCDGSCQLQKMVHSHHHHHSSEKPSSPIPQQQKIDLFVSIQDILIRPVNYLSLFPATYTNKMDTLWLKEPLSPPPQIA